MYIQNILMYAITGFLSISIPFNKYNLPVDYVQIANTNMYADKDITIDELNDIVKYYNMIPTGILEKFKENNIEIYLTEYDTTDKYFINSYYDNAPYFIESNAKDIANLKTIEKNDGTYLIYHGNYIGPLDYNTLDWNYWINKYMEDSDYYGANYFNYNYSVDTNNEYGYVTMPLKKDDVLEHNGYVYYYINNNVYRPEYILHEVGVKFDYLVGVEQFNEQIKGISTQQQWIELYNKHSHIMYEFDDLSKQKVPINAEEGFAEAFRLTVQYSVKFKELCPEIYDYVLKQILTYGSVVTKDNFNYKGYADRYVDIKTAFGYNIDLLYKHYVEYGLLEERLG